ncbi:MAG: ABC transporter permease [Armatimonadota bacterium]|nr:ABC transporter permease [Armatimonadota bacterium]MDR7485927.1 ABC transporter permease [Armatimonadota bacterium]MDR7533122.1 ABC transporter permease [Armatimonadota bacterium]MDR7536632.1 ABC transporter permease [Armatimonadota bacterium]
MRARRVPADALLAAVLGLLAGVSLVALVAPSVLVVVTSFNASEFLTFPPQGWSLRWYAAMAGNWEVRQAAALSFKLAALVVAVDLLLGVPAAFPLTRARFRGREALLTFILSPLMLPGIVIGIGLLFFYMLLGLALSFPLLVVSHVVVTLPFVVSMTSARLATLDPTYEEAAQGLGASQVQKFVHVVLPQLWPGIAAGAAFAFLLSFDNFTVSLFTASDRLRPLPIVLFYLLRYDINPLVGAVSSLEIGLALLVLLVGSRLLGLARVAQLSRRVT